MRLTSTDFANGAALHPRFTCDGGDVRPHLAWDGVPAGTQSFAISCLDPDAPRGEFAHWLVHGIPADVHELSQAAAMPAGAVGVVNDFGVADYGGPCPPSGEHHYVFTLYALDVPRLGDVTRATFVRAAQAHALATATLMGRYRRQR